MQRLVVLLVALIAAACSPAVDEVRPFEDIQASEFVFENDPSFPDRGIFRVTTTEPAICAIAWGETEALGHFNNSLDMNGTGIIEHDVFLPGTVPGVTYYFRVQGSTADGALYRSELMTFTLPDVEGRPEQPDRGQNLALDVAVVDASSEFSASWAASNAFDGDLATEWATAGDGDEGFIVVDLGEEVTVGGVEFVTRSMTNGTAITDTFTISVDGASPLGPFQAGNPADPKFQEASFTGQVIRFDIASSTGGNTGAVEIRLFGSG